MHVILKHNITGVETVHDSLKSVCKFLSIDESDLQLDYNHKKFDNGIYQRYVYRIVFDITVYETFEGLMDKLKNRKISCSCSEFSHAKSAYRFLNHLGE